MSSALLCKRRWEGKGFGARVPYARPATVVVSLCRVVCCGVLAISRFVRERGVGTDGCSQGFQCPFAQVSGAEATFEREDDWFALTAL